MTAPNIRRGEWYIRRDGSDRFAVQIVELTATTVTHVQEWSRDYPENRDETPRTIFEAKYRRLTAEEKRL